MHTVSKGDSYQFNYSTYKPVMKVDFSFSDNTHGFIVEGVLDKKSAIELRAQALKILETVDKINFYVEDNDIKRFTLPAIIIALIFPLRHANRFDKIALVTNRKWIKRLAYIDNYLTRGEIRHYTIENRMDAVLWIAKKDSL